MLLERSPTRRASTFLSMSESGGTGRVLGPQSGLGEAKVPAAPEDPSRLRASRAPGRRPTRSGGQAALKPVSEG